MKKLLFLFLVIPFLFAASPLQQKHLAVIAALSGITDLVTNGDFSSTEAGTVNDDPVDWVSTDVDANAYIYADGSTCRIYSTTAYIAVTQAMTMAGLSCHLTLDVTVDGGGAVAIGSYIGGSDIGTLNSTGSKNFDFTGNNVDVNKNNLSFKRSSGAGDDLTIDNVVVWCD